MLLDAARIRRSSKMKKRELVEESHSNAARRWRSSTETKHELVDARPSNASRLEDGETGSWRNATSWLQVPNTTVRAGQNITRDHRARLVSSNRECFAHYTHFLLFQQIFFVFRCIHAGNARVPPRVLASGQKSLCLCHAYCYLFVCLFVFLFFWHICNFLVTKPN